MYLTPGVSPCRKVRGLICQLVILCWHSVDVVICTCTTNLEVKKRSKAPVDWYAHNKWVILLQMDSAWVYLHGGPFTFEETFMNQFWMMYKLMDDNNYWYCTRSGALVRSVLFSEARFLSKRLRYITVLVNHSYRHLGACAICVGAQQPSKVS